MTGSISPQDTVERALALSKADACVVIATEQSEANLRFASNTLTTNGEMRSRRLAVISMVNGQAGTASAVLERSAVDADDLETLVRSAEQAARDAGPAEDAMPLVEPADNHPGTAGWADPAATTSIEIFDRFAGELGETFRRAGAEQRLLFGFAEHVVESTYLGTSTGLRLRHDQPTGRLELNAKSPDYTRSVWSGQGTEDFRDVDMLAADQHLATRLRWEERRTDLEPGRYETVLPPSAVGDLMTYIYWIAIGRDADEGRTVFSKKGGGSRIGERLTEVPITLRSDPSAAGLRCAPFVNTTWSHPAFSVFDNGLPTEPVEWISSGVLTNLLKSRSWASRTDSQPTMFVDNLLLGAPDATGSLEDLVAHTERGLLLTSLWYIRMVDPQTMLLTGLTRDGVYLVENGEVTSAVNNFRFNESPVGMLARIAEVGRSERTLPRELSDFFNRASMPPLRVADFNMSTVSKGV
jgi:predicted Zn-dependent protease